MFGEFVVINKVYLFLKSMFLSYEFKIFICKMGYYNIYCTNKTKRVNFINVQVASHMHLSNKYEFVSLEIIVCCI